MGKDQGRVPLCSFDRFNGPVPVRFHMSTISIAETEGTGHAIEVLRRLPGAHLKYLIISSSFNNYNERRWPSNVAKGCF